MKNYVIALVLFLAPVYGFAQTDKGVWIKCVINRNDVFRYPGKPYETPKRKVGDELIYYVDTRVLYEYSKENTLNEIKFAEFKPDTIELYNPGTKHSLVIDRRTLAYDEGILGYASSEDIKGQCTKTGPYPVKANQL